MRAGTGTKLLHQRRAGLPQLPAGVPQLPAGRLEGFPQLSMATRPGQLFKESPVRGRTCSNHGTISQFRAEKPVGAIPLTKHDLHSEAGNS